MWTSVQKRMEPHVRLGRVSWAASMGGGELGMAVGSAPSRPCLSERSWEGVFSARTAARPLQGAGVRMPEQTDTQGVQGWWETGHTTDFTPLSSQK